VAKLVGSLSLAVAALLFCTAQMAMPNAHIVQRGGQNCGSGGVCDVIFVSHPSKRETLWEIVQPSVVEPQTGYPQIRFKPDDTIEITAGGCVQSGGSGSTWHLYVNPVGGSAQTYYSGTVYIPGFIPAAGGADVTGFWRLGGYVGRELHMEHGLAKTGKLAGIKPSDIFLHLGFEDEQGDYGDNGYYGHDNGDNNQCLGVGPAWVEVEVTSKESREPVWSQSQSKPFDVVWHEDDGWDGNWLPLNPFWAAQIGPPVGTPKVAVPDFAGTCGSAFNGNTWSDGGTIYQNVLAAKCTSQAPSDDLYSGVTWAGSHCAWDPVGGHVDWTNATYSGKVFWDNYSGPWWNDDDININLAPDHDAGITTQENKLIGLEFDQGETLDNYTTPFWANMETNEDKNSLLDEQLAGKRAVVTGVLGIDGVHNGYAEIHPVFALAIQNGETESGDGVDETWEFFVRNSGDEGGCSTKNEHWWNGLSDNESGGSAWYFLNLPWPKGASDFKIAKFSGEGSQSGIVGPTTVKGAGWTYVGFRWPASSAASVDGELTIHYSFRKKDDRERRGEHSLHRKGHADEDADWSDAVAKLKDPGVRQQMTAFFAANKPRLYTARPDTFRIEPGHADLALRAITSVKDEDRDRIRRDHIKVDAARQAALKEFDVKLKAIMATLHIGPESFKKLRESRSKE
jgi:hypothetical protein